VSWDHGLWSDSITAEGRQKSGVHVHKKVDTEDPLRQIRRLLSTMSECSRFQLLAISRSDTLAWKPRELCKVLELWLVRIDQHRVPLCTSMNEETRIAHSKHQVMNLKILFRV
jgi:hypothetical protein